MKGAACLVAACLAIAATPSLAQGEYIVVTATRLPSKGAPPVPPPPVVGLRRQADSAVRDVEIVSDSRTEDLRRSEVQAMLLAAIDLARREGVTLVTGEFELVEVNRENWQDQFPGLARPDTAEEEEEDEDDDDSDYGDEDDAPPPAFKDDGSIMVVRLKVKTRLDGSVDNAEKKITAFVRKVPVTGRSQMKQRGGLALTIVNPEQYRGEIYGRIATAAKTAAGFYGPDYGLEVTGLDHAIEWKQVSNTEVFLFIRYDFAVRK